MSQSSLLTPLQSAFLNAFFTLPAGRQFFLVGGTALAEFYLRHRYSEDIDLFTLDEDAFQEIGTRLTIVAADSGATLKERIASSHFRQVFLQAPGQPELKIDLVRDVGPQFGEHTRVGNVVVDSLLNIAVNKVTALFGRAASKDFVDLYFLLGRRFQLDDLIPLAKEKDPGLTEFYLAGMLRRVAGIKQLPRMIYPLTPEELRTFFLPLAEQIMLKTKPPE